MRPVKRKRSFNVSDSEKWDSLKKYRVVVETETDTFDLEHLDIELNPLEDVIEKYSLNRSTTCHPLQNQLILSFLFQFLNLEDMKSCRSVCRLWNEELQSRFRKKALIELNMTYPEVGRSPEECLRNLMKNQESFPCNNLQVSGIDFFNWDLRQIFQLYGKGLESLTLDASASSSGSEIKMDRKHLMRFSQLCPNLQSLDLIDLPDAVIQKGFPRLMLALMKNSFPNLKKFSFQFTGFFCPLDAQFIMDFMDFAPNLIELSFSVGDDDALDEIMSALELRSTFMEQVQILKFGHDFGNTLFETHIQTLLILDLNNLKHLEINSIGSDITGQTLTWLLEKLSPTLEILKIGDMANPVQTQRDELYLRFPDLMDKLKHLEISDVHCVWGWLGSIRFLERLPNLETCFLQRSNNFLSTMDDKQNEKFGRNLFPGGSKMKGFRHDRLEDLMLPKDLWCIDFVSSLKDYFPALRRLSLDMNRHEMLPGVIETLKDSSIEELFLKVIPVTPEFDAALTGIPAADCQKMAKERTYWPVDPANSLKVWSSFADWKCLRKLSIISKTADYHPLTGVAVFYGFALAGNITSLKLENFEMRDVFVLELLNKMPLSTLKLIGCNVIPSVWGGANGIQDRIKIVFPTVDFCIDPSTPAHSQVHDHHDDAR